MGFRVFLFVRVLCVLGFVFLWVCRWREGFGVGDFGGLVGLSRQGQRGQLAIQAAHQPRAHSNWVAGWLAG